MKEIKKLWEELRKIMMQESELWSDYLDKRQELFEKRSLIQAELGAYISINAPEGK